MGSELEKVVSDICTEVSEVNKVKKTKTSDKKEYYNNYYHETKEKVLCTCGKLVNKRNKSKHMKSYMHERDVKKKNLEIEVQQLKDILYTV